MLSLSSDQTALLVGIMGNIVLNVAIQLQKYAKKQIIHLALHGLPAINTKRLWYLGLSMLLFAECSNFVVYGLTYVPAISPLGVFTAITNCVLPPLFFENDMHTITGSFITLLGLLLMILSQPSPSGPLKLTINDNGKLVLMLEGILGLLFLLCRVYKVANCALNLASSCGIAALMGSYSVTAIKIIGLPDTDSLRTFLMALIVFTCIVEVVLLSEALHLFPVWQVVPHHFAMFMTFAFINHGFLLGKFDYAAPAGTMIALIAYSLVFTGVCVSAKPHLDIPANIFQETALWQHLEEQALRGCSSSETSDQSSEDATHQLMRSTPSSHDSHMSDMSILDNERGHCLLRQEYQKYQHKQMLENEGFRRRSSQISLA